MAFVGRATFDNSTVTHEDLSDRVTINSTIATPLLDALGDADEAATQTLHEWVEDVNLSNTDQLNEALDATETGVDVDDGSKFRIKDVILVDEELMLVTAIATNTLTVTRDYAGTTGATHADNAEVRIIGNATLEGSDPVATDYDASARTRKTNYIQMMRPHATEVSDTLNNVSQAGGMREADHQLNLRLNEGLRMLESSVINSRKHDATPGGSATIGRTMEGIKWWLSSNVTDMSSAKLTQEKLHEELQTAWDNGAQNMDLLVCGAYNKGLISRYTNASTRYTGGDNNRVRIKVDEIETDYGTLRVLPPNRNIPKDEVLILSSRYIEVKPLQGSSFQRKPLARTGSSEKALVEGEYGVEVRHENAHVWLKNTATAN